MAQRSHSAISQSLYVGVDNRLITLVLALYDDAGRFCRGEEASGRSAVEPSGGKNGGECGAPTKKGREGFQLYLGFNWNPAEE